MAPKTAAQRKADRKELAKELQSSIIEQVQELSTTEAWERYLTFASSFHGYSFRNVLLILSQFPDASRVAGYRKWQSLGRQVVKGSKAIKIYGYSKKTIRTEEDEETGEEKEVLTVYFPIVSVFDMSQTEPIEGFADPFEIVSKLEGDDPLGLYEAVSTYLTSLGWKISREPIPRDVNGFTTIDGTKRVVIEESLAPAQAAKTLLHEAAHVILHEDNTEEEYAEHRGLKETEAESVAYVVAGAFGFDTSQYSIGYVAGWSMLDHAVIAESAANVLKAAHELIDVITEITAESVATVS